MIFADLLPCGEPNEEILEIGVAVEELLKPPTLRRNVVKHPVEHQSILQTQFLDFIPCPQVGIYLLIVNHREPSICVGFEAGWFRFMLSTVHIVWGKGVEGHPNRVAEIQSLASFLKDRSEDKHAWSQNLILLGDFNIFNAATSNAAYSAIVQNGFVIPESLQNIPPTNVGSDPRFYDQIALRTRLNNLAPSGRGGVFDFFDVVYRDNDYDDYVPAMMDGKATDDPDNKLTFDTKGNLRSEEKRRSYYRNHWRRRQMSDHLPMWLELQIDYGQNYLKKRFA